MRNIILLILLVLYACGTTSLSNASQDSDAVIIKNEEIDYEITIIEPGFINWLATQQPESYYNIKTLEVKNNLYVMSWNRRVLDPLKYNPELYQLQIDYSANIDYGKEVNYKLYMYFKYFQKKYNQNLL